VEGRTVVAAHEEVAAWEQGALGDGMEEGAESQGCAAAPPGVGRVEGEMGSEEGSETAVVVRAERARAVAVRVGAALAEEAGVVVARAAVGQVAAVQVVAGLVAVEEATGASRAAVAVAVAMAVAAVTALVVAVRAAAGGSAEAWSVAVALPVAVAALAVRRRATREDGRAAAAKVMEATVMVTGEAGVVPLGRVGAAVVAVAMQVGAGEAVS
jgi:hypothetical protein